MWPPGAKWLSTTAVEQVTHTQFLGVYIDEHLNWKQHIYLVSSKLRRISSLFSSLLYTNSLKTYINHYFILTLSTVVIFGETLIFIFIFIFILMKCYVLAYKPFSKVFPMHIQCFLIVIPAIIMYVLHINLLQLFARKPCILIAPCPPL